jgi:hypothetical protein
MDPLAIFWVLTNSSYLGKYLGSGPQSFMMTIAQKKEEKLEKLLGLMPIG